jgi:hypothetical protein
VATSRSPYVSRSSRIVDEMDDLARNGRIGHLTDQVEGLVRDNRVEVRVSSAHLREAPLRGAISCPDAQPRPVGHFPGNGLWQMGHRRVALAAHNRIHTGSSMRIARVLLLAEPPSLTPTRSPTRATSTSAPHASASIPRSARSTPNRRHPTSSSARESEGPSDAHRVGPRQVVRHDGTSQPSRRFLTREHSASSSECRYGRSTTFSSSGATTRSLSRATSGATRHGLFNQRRVPRPGA